MICGYSCGCNVVPVTSEILALTYEQLTQVPHLKQTSVETSPVVAVTLDVILLQVQDDLVNLNCSLPGSSPERR